MAYNAGDKFVLEVLGRSNHDYNGYVTNTGLHYTERDLDKLERVKDEREIASEVWEYAKRIFFLDKDCGLTCKEFNAIFGKMSKYDVLCMEPLEAIGMIKEWEKSIIRVGDIVKCSPDDAKYVVTNVSDEVYSLLRLSDLCAMRFHKDGLERTGENIDLSPLLNND